MGPFSLESFTIKDILPSGDNQKIGLFLPSCFGEGFRIHPLDHMLGKANLFLETFYGVAERHSTHPLIDIDHDLSHFSPLLVCFKKSRIP